MAFFVFCFFASPLPPVCLAPVTMPRAPLGRQCESYLRNLRGRYRVNTRNNGPWGRGHRGHCAGAGRDESRDGIVFSERRGLGSERSLSRGRAMTECHRLRAASGATLRISSCRLGSPTDERPLRPALAPAPGTGHRHHRTAEWRSEQRVRLSLNPHVVFSPFPGTREPTKHLRATFVITTKKKKKHPKDSCSE